MFYYFLFISLVAAPSVVSSGGFTAYLNETGSSISIFDIDDDVLFTEEAEGGERLSYPQFSRFKLIFCSSSRGLLVRDLLTGELVVLNSGKTGVPWISSDGDVWYSTDGFLAVNSTVTDLPVSSFSVSVENSVAVFTDRSDNLHIVSLEDGSDRLVSGYRFYLPFVLQNGDVIASTLCGSIVYVPFNEDLVVLASGTQPCWSTELSGLFYCVSEDDGHNLTGADLWFVRLNELPVRVTYTPEVFETKPSCSGDYLWFIDAVSDAPDFLRLNDISF